MSRFFLVDASEDSPIALEISRSEAEVLINLAEQLIELLCEDAPQIAVEVADPLSQLSDLFDNRGNPETPSDAVLMRLFPNAYSDPEAAADFRRFTQAEIAQLKLEQLREMREILVLTADAVDDETDLLSMTVENPDDWLIAINDIRLALAVRLNVDADSYENYELIADSDPQKALFAVYFWLGSLQGELIPLLFR